MPSATINLIRKRPLTELDASVCATVGSFDLKRGEADVSLPAAAAARGRVRDGPGFAPTAPPGWTEPVAGPGTSDGRDRQARAHRRTVRFLAMAAPRALLQPPCRVGRWNASTRARRRTG